MPEYDDSNSGILFLEDKGGNDRKPDYTGKINVAGQEFRLAGWWRTPKRGGDRFLSLKVTDFETPGQTLAANGGNDDDQLPF